MSIESRYFDAVISKVDVIHLIPIEVRNKKQFRLSWLDKVYRVVPVASRCPRSWLLNQDWDSMHLHMRRNYVEEADGIPENVLQRPFSVNLRQYEFLKEEFLDFMELFD